MDTRRRSYRSFITVPILLFLAAFTIIPKNPRVSGPLPLAPASVFAAQEARIEPAEREISAVREKLLERLRNHGTTEEQLNEVQRRFEADGTRASLPASMQRRTLKGPSVADAMRRGQLGELVRSKDFTKLDNCTELAEAYVVSNRFYNIEGIRNDGRVDRVSLSGKHFWLNFNTDQFAALPRRKDQYKRVRIQYFPDNSFSIRRSSARQSWLFEPLNPPAKGSISLDGNPPTGDGESVVEFSSAPGSKLIELSRDEKIWKQQSAAADTPAVPLRKTPSHALMRFMNVTHMDDGTVVDMITPGATGGTTRWVVTPDEPESKKEIAEWVDQSGSVVHSGDELPDNVLQSLFEGNKGSYLRTSGRSANRRQSDLTVAAELGRKPLDVSRLKFFNALPQEASFSGSLRELNKMDLSFRDRKSWQELNERVKETAGSVNLPVLAAKKADMLNELQHGSSDVIFIVAHGTGESIYLPGTNGDAISAADLAQSRRILTPNRIAILITCKGGQINGSSASLGEAVLQHRLARVVFATKEDVDAREVPALIRELVGSGRPVQDVMNDHRFRRFAGNLLHLLRAGDS